MAEANGDHRTNTSSAEQAPKKQKLEHQNDGSDQGTPSSALESLLLGHSSVETFLCNEWQTKPLLLRRNLNTHDTQNPSLENCIRMGIEGVAAILEGSKSRFMTDDDDDSSNMTSLLAPPLFFQHQKPVSYDVVQDVYGNNPFAAFLDGCSVVINHVDQQCGEAAVGDLCHDFQRTFPHVYANSYLTPPQSQAVPAHADDRDVFVLQIYGKKKWKVYKKVPITLPYPEEQVGKNGLPVPTEVLQGGHILMDETLWVGDCLYMPRGYVHEATSVDNDCSFHITFAIATQDWSLAKAVADSVRAHLDQTPAFRKGLVPFRAQDVSNHLDEIWPELKEQITAATLQQHLLTKYNHHNSIAQMGRVARQESSPGKASADIVGHKAATRVNLNTKIRASTKEEKAYAQSTVSTSLKGLTVREEIMSWFTNILSTMKADPGKQIQVGDIKNQTLFPAKDARSQDLICDLTALSFARCCVDLGAMAIVED